MVRKKPFYLRDPWVILFKDRKLDKVSPWSIDLVNLLTTLLEEMNKVGIDFRMAGTAINSSVLIYLKKAELLLKMEEPPQAPPAKPNVYVPPPLSLPFRFEFTTTSVSDLITALEKAIAEGRRSAHNPTLPILPMPIPDFLDVEAYLLEIEEHAEDLLDRMKGMGAGSLSLCNLTADKSWFEVVRTFMLLLFLAQLDKIDLYQDEDETDVMIKVKESYEDE